MKTLAVIPARYASQRFPGKPLALIAGKPMVRHVWERCRQASEVDEVIIATDDERIRDVCVKFSAQCLLTDPALPSGTDRCAAVAREHHEYDLVLNVQGDEPGIAPATIDALVALLDSDAVSIASAVTPLADRALLADPNVVKVALTASGRALYFSRSLIPFERDPSPANPVRHFRHLGLYGFRRETLLAVTKLPPSGLERAESLEQLRWLEAGYEIYCTEVSDDSSGIDTPDQLRNFERKLKQQD